MDGMQKTAYERLVEMAGKVKDGAYGTDDDLAVDTLYDDLDELLDDM